MKFDNINNLLYNLEYFLCIGKAIGPMPSEYKEFLYEPNVSLEPNGTLYFKKITKESQGHFLCEAKNNIGTGVSKVIFLKVNGNVRTEFVVCIHCILHMHSQECSESIVDITLHWQKVL